MLVSRARPVIIFSTQNCLYRLNTLYSHQVSYRFVVVVAVAVVLFAVSRIPFLAFPFSSSSSSLPYRFPFKTVVVYPPIITSFLSLHFAPFRTKFHECNCPSIHAPPTGVFYGRLFPPCHSLSPLSSHQPPTPNPRRPLYQSCAVGSAPLIFTLKSFTKSSFLPTPPTASLSPSPPYELRNNATAQKPKPQN